MRINAKIIKSGVHGGPHHIPYLFQGVAPHDPSVRFFLLGSQHNLPAKFMPEGIKKLLHSSDVLVKEVIDSVFGDAGDISLKELKLHGLIADEASQNWTTFLSPSARHYFEQFISQGITEAWSIKPHQISPVVVDHVVSDWGRNLSSDPSMDQVITRTFQTSNKPVLALENGKIRFDADDTLFALSNRHRQNSLSENAQLLDDTIVERLLPRAEESLDEKTVADFSEYFAGNVENLFPEDNARDLFKRNLAWIETIENYVNQFSGKTILFIFGFAHLSGRYSVVQLLKNLGYHICPVVDELYPMEKNLTQSGHCQA
jgi:uncharacterized protein YbaP (TraB family)